VEVAVVRKIKRPDATMTFAAHVVHDDEHGLWMFTPRGSLVHNVKDGASFHKPMGQGTEPGFLWLMPRDEWWYAGWWTRPDREQTAVDACTIPTLVDGIWTWTDLELDICRDQTGAVWVEDEDEFEDAIAAGHIPSDEQAAALAITAEIVRRLTERVRPFDDLGWERYAALCARDLAPLDAPES
jgi:hypothetical protein